MSGLATIEDAVRDIARREGVPIPTPSRTRLRKILKAAKVFVPDWRQRSPEHAACLFFEAEHAPPVWADTDALEDGDPLPTMPDPIVLAFVLDDEAKPPWTTSTGPGG